MTEPADIRGILSQLARRWGLENPNEMVGLFRDWDSIVGEGVAERCQPVSLKDGVLKVVSNNPAWAAELRYLAPEIVRRVNEELKEGLVTEVKVAVARPGQAPSQKPRKKRP